MKRHGHVKGANKMVMFALLAVLLVSLGYLSMQGKEGFKEGAVPTAKPPTPSVMPSAMPPAMPSAPKKK